MSNQSSDVQRRVNLNADLGESFGAWRMGDDAAMLSVVKSANIACGFHAGDPMVMRRTLALAREHGVSVGAHPSFADLQGFGRRRIEMSAAEVEAMLMYQVGALQGLARAERMEVTHVKPHGALNNMACEDPVLAATIARAVRAMDSQLVLLAPALSCMVTAGREAGLTVVEEVFADRAYADNGTLMPRSVPGAVLHDAAACVAHVMRIVRTGALHSVHGIQLPVNVQSICVHGDNAKAVDSARAIVVALAADGYQVVALPDVSKSAA
jgi:5-oxoprolinase (ATP-hydrolysing) subunit A